MLGVVCAFDAFGAAPKSQALHEGDLVTISGKLERVWNFGPPNYGDNPESDRIMNYIILRPNHPIDVDDVEGDIVRNAHRVRLIFPPELWKEINNLVAEKVVSLSGHIRLQSMAIEMEPVLLTIEDLKGASSVIVRHTAGGAQ